MRDKREKYSRRRDPQPNALPVFTVDTMEQGALLREQFCVLTHDGRYVWTPGLGGWERSNHETLDGVTGVLRSAYAAMETDTR